MAPVSCFLSGHIRDSRRDFDGDDFNEEMPLKDVCQDTRAGGKLCKRSLALHPEAKLTGADIRTVCAWKHEARPK